MKNNITLDDAIRALRKAVLANPTNVQPRFDFVTAADADHGKEPIVVGNGDGTCRYSDPIKGGPSCIIGQAIFNIDRELFHQIAEVGGSASVLVDDHLRDQLKVSVDPLAAKLFTNTQLQADTGTPWKTAFERGLAVTLTS